MNAENLMVYVALFLFALWRYSKYRRRLKSAYVDSYDFNKGLILKIARTIMEQVIVPQTSAVQGTVGAAEVQIRSVPADQVAARAAEEIRR